MTRRYSDRERGQALAVLDSCAGNIDRAAALSGVPAATLRTWREGVAITPDALAIREALKPELVTRLDDLADKIIDALLTKLDSANAKDLAIALGIAIDKRLLLRREPTSIQEVQVSLSPEERAARLSSLLEAARARAGDLPAGDVVAGKLSVDDE